ncbi:MAG: polyhydroxyalkanoate synthesis regulator DNA-binding domain-containing protein [Candidatus Rokubacteria bacterium]|nr:polyhydroxyalkanoate synthesis regulator DNA-binding domain-containing protein [Candidatus Rokubacteria bacterium]
MAYVIKRYSNRKLYDIQESRYVTLEELEELIRAGKEISVVDAATGEDLTSVTLAQIILDSERNRRATLPTAFLHQLIKHGEAWQDFVQKSLRSSLEGIITSQRAADRIFREWAARSGLVPPPERTGRGEKGREVAPGVENLKEEVAALKEKLRAVEEKLGRKKGR